MPWPAWLFLVGMGVAAVCCFAVAFAKDEPPTVTEHRDAMRALGRSTRTERSTGCYTPEPGERW